MHPLHECRGFIIQKARDVLRSTFRHAVDVHLHEGIIKHVQIPTCGYRAQRRVIDLLKIFFIYVPKKWPAPGSEDTKFGVTMGPEVRHGEAEVHAGVQA